MRDVIRQILQQLNKDFGGSIFVNPKRFKAALEDLQIETDAKKVRHLLNVAIRDMQIYSRLESELSNNPFIIDNLMIEMSSDFMIDKDVAKLVIESIAELLGYIPKYEISSETDDNDKETEQTDAKAEYEKGFAYYQGIGAVKDLTLARRHLENAAVNGHIEAQCALGELLSDANNPQADPVQAMEWYSKAAESGHPKAQWFLGAGYMSGVGAEKDIEKAKYWFKKSADQGNADGQYGLGAYYFSMEDYKEAAYWLGKATVKGHSEAKDFLEAALFLSR